MKVAARPRNHLDLLARRQRPGTPGPGQRASRQALDRSQFAAQFDACRACRRHQCDALDWAAHQVGRGRIVRAVQCVGQSRHLLAVDDRKVRVQPGRSDVASSNSASSASRRSSRSPSRDLTRRRVTTTARSCRAGSTAAISPTPTSSTQSAKHRRLGARASLSSADNGQPVAFYHCERHRSLKAPHHSLRVAASCGPRATRASAASALSASATVCRTPGNKCVHHGRASRRLE